LKKRKKSQMVKMLLLLLLVGGMELSVVGDAIGANLILPRLPLDGVIGLSGDFNGDDGLIEAAGVGSVVDATAGGIWDKL
jgi:N-acetylglucosamine kinase-like BadF-type ATPase